MEEKWKCRESLCDGRAESTKWVWKPGDRPRKGEGWCWKENVNEEHQQMNNNSNKMKINITKTSGGSPKQVPPLGVFDYLWLFVIYVNNYLWLVYDYFIIIDNYL